MAVVIGGKKPAMKNEFDTHTAAPTQASVSVEKKVSGSKDYKLEHQEEIELDSGNLIPSDKLCRIEVEGGRTVNLGNFESARFGVKISMPCHMNDLDSAYDSAREWVDKKMMEVMDDGKGKK